jgi:hypothetical protein
VLPPQWGDGGTDVIVVGHHRGTKGRGLVRMVIPRRHLTGFRVQPVYSPAVARELTRPLTEFNREHAPVMWPDREAAAQSAERWRDRLPRHLFPRSSASRAGLKLDHEDGGGLSTGTRQARAGGTCSTATTPLSACVEVPKV